MKLACDFHGIARRKLCRVRQADIQQHGIDDKTSVAEICKSIRHRADYPDGLGRIGAAEAQKPIDGKVLIREERIRDQIEGGQFALAAVRRTRPVVSPAPPPTASTATPTSLLVATVLVTRDVATSQ